MNATLREVLTTGYWAMEAESFIAYKQIVLGNLQSRTTLEFEKTIPLNELLGVGKSFDPQSKVYIGNSQRISWWHELDESDHIVNMINVQDVIVRGGGACSYGSMEIRDALIAAADVKQTRAHILKINSPGGAVNALKDFKIAIDYCRSKNQPVYALIDGWAASLAFEVAALCDKIYYTNVEDEIGSVGTMWATYTQKHGDQNSITQERYVERYASRAVDKNASYRQAADGNFELIDSELDSLTNMFVALISSRRPKVKPERLTGKMFKVTEVLGELTDGQRTVMQIVDEILKPYGITTDPSTVAQNNATTGESIGDAPQSQTVNNNQNNKTMDLSKINAAMGLSVPVEQDSDGGVYLNGDQLAEFDAHLEATQNSAEEIVGQLNEALQVNQHLEAENSKLKAEIAELEKAQSEVDEAKAEWESQHQANIDALSDEHAKEVERLTNEKAELEQQVARLAERSGVEIEAGGAPRSDQFAPKTAVSEAWVYDSEKSPIENKKLYEQYMNRLKQTI